MQRNDMYAVAGQAPSLLETLQCCLALYFSSLCITSENAQPIAKTRESTGDPELGIGQALLRCQVNVENTFLAFL